MFFERERMKEKKSWTSFFFVFGFLSWNKKLCWFFYVLLYISTFSGGRDVKYLHKVVTQKNPIHKTRNATSCVFSQSRVHNEKKMNEKSDYMKVFLFIFHFIIFPSSLSTFVLCCKEELVLFKEQRVTLSSISELFFEGSVKLCNLRRIFL